MPKHTKALSLLTLLLLLLLLLIFAAACEQRQASRPVVPFKEVTPAELLSWMEEGRELLLVDVREEYEYNEGYIPGSILLPLGELIENYAQLDRDKEIILICRSGRRSGLAAQFLSEEGYTRVYNLVGGMLAWRGPVHRVREFYS